MEFPVGGTVLDPFAGTFTTCAVAQRLGRISVGIEREDEYLKIGLRRLGVASHHNGEELRPPEKSYTRRRDGSINSGLRYASQEQTGLYDGTI